MKKTPMPPSSLTSWAKGLSFLRAAYASIAPWNGSRDLKCVHWIFAACIFMLKGAVAACAVPMDEACLECNIALDEFVMRL